MTDLIKYLKRNRLDQFPHDVINLVGGKSIPPNNKGLESHIRKVLQVDLGFKVPLIVEQ